MKTVLRTNQYLIIVVIILGCAITFTSAQQAHRGGGATGKVEIYPDGIVIHPTIQLRPDDERQLNQALATANKSFYKLEKLGQARLQPQGELKISTALEQEMKDAKTKHAKGLCVNFVPTGGGPANAARAHLMADQKELLDKITPILKKYQ